MSSISRRNRFIGIILLEGVAVLLIFIAVFAPTIGLCPRVFNGEGLRRQHVFGIGIVLLLFSSLYLHIKLMPFSQLGYFLLSVVKRGKQLPGYILNPCLSLFSIVVTFTILECGIRIYEGNYTFMNNLTQTRNLFQSKYPVQHDPGLGWIPKTGVYKNTAGSDVTITILQNGIRSNGPSSVSRDHTQPILAIGDSFTFGDGVSDHETWPAILELLIGRPVINAGVFGYGIDQAFLRAKKLILLYRPTTVIFSFIPNDIQRCELSKRNHAGKPYFEVNNERLVLKNVPVPLPTPYKLGKIRQLLSYSYFIHTLMMRLFPTYWLQGVSGSTQVHAEGETVACLLFRELEELTRENHLETYLLVQYPETPSDEELQMIDRILRCVNHDTLHLVNLREKFAKQRVQHYEQYQRYFNVHMTYAGNYFVALHLKEAINGDGSTISVQNSSTSLQGFSEVVAY